MIPDFQETVKSGFLAGTGSLAVKTLANIFLTLLQVQNFGPELLRNIGSELALNLVRLSLDWDW